VTTNFNLVTINNDSCSGVAAAIPIKETPKEGSSDKSYLFKSNNLNNNNFCNINGLTSNNHHQRHMSVPVGGNITPVKTLPTSSSTFQASITQKMPNNSPLKAPSTSTSNPSPPTATTMTSVKILPTNQQLYENIKIKSLNNINNNHNNNSNNVSYENINLEYINRLMKEGYSKESVISALCISRNNFEMACDILHEFVSTNQQAGKVADVNR
jgi:hypothetical protein